MAKSRSFSVLPGFGLSLGYTLVYLGLIVLIPLAAVFIKTAELSWDQFWANQMVYGDTLVRKVIIGQLRRLILKMVIRSSSDIIIQVSLYQETIMMMEQIM